MRQPRTVFVLGAGASEPYNYPLGRQLVRDILTYQPGSQTLLGHVADEYKVFTNALRQSAAYSVDLFLERNDKFVEIGKKAIAWSLMTNENPSLLWEDEYPHSSYSPRVAEFHNWYKFLFNRLVTGVPFEKVADWSVGFVTFNYDRSLEHFLFTSVKNFYGKSDVEATEALRNLRVIHVHGDLGGLPWQPSDRWRRPYDNRTTNELIDETAKHITILHEAQDSSKQFDEARALIRNADRVYVLGFGYHPTNIKRLRLGMEEMKQSPVGTWVGLTNEEKTSIMRSASMAFPANGGGTIIQCLRSDQAFVDMTWTD
jgi:hypothetical protein